MRTIAREHVVRAFFLLIVLSALATPAAAQSLQVVGYSGYLGEWELTATVTETASSRIKEYSGPLTMKHIGLCTQDGPEEKIGEMRFRISTSPAAIECDIIGCWDRMHLQRTTVRLLYRHDELPRSTGGSAQAMVEIDSPSASPAEVSPRTKSVVGRQSKSGTSSLGGRTSECRHRSGRAVRWSSCAILL